MSAFAIKHLEMNPVAPLVTLVSKGGRCEYRYTYNNASINKVSYLGHVGRRTRGLMIGSRFNGCSSLSAFVSSLLSSSPEDDPTKLVLDFPKEMLSFGCGGGELNVGSIHSHRFITTLYILFCVTMTMYPNLEQTATTNSPSGRRRAVEELHVLCIQAQEIGIVARVTSVPLLVELLDRQRCCVTRVTPDLTNPLHADVVLEHGWGWGLNNDAHLRELYSRLHLRALLFAVVIEADVTGSVANAALLLQCGR